MRYLRLSIEVPDGDRHPMHAFAIEHGGYAAYWLLHWQWRPDEGATMLFYVEGPLDPYVEALETRTATATHSTAAAGREGFYLYARAEMTGFDRGLVAAMDRAGVLFVPPVEYRMDGSMALALVGPPAELAAAVESLPAAVDATVLEIGPYERRTLRTAGDLTERQRQVVAAAADLGYYEEPREATVADVAAATDCSPSTAAEHLRKAEAAVMERAAAGPVTPPVAKEDASRGGDKA